MAKLNWDRVKREDSMRAAPRPFHPQTGRFQAKFGGTCAICHAVFPVGTSCAYTLVEGKRRIVHGACL